MTDNLSTSICDEYGITYPVFGFAHSINATIAITNAGGFGVFGGTRSTPEEIEQAMATIRAAVGDKPFGIDLVMPPGMPDQDNRDAIEAEIPDRHRQFVSDIIDKYQVPAGTKPGMRSRFVRSNEMLDQQLEAVMQSDVNLFACGIGAPPRAVDQAKARGKKTCALVGSPHHMQKLLQTGIDLVVAQGYDAGAHTGKIGTFSLIPQIVEAAEGLPVLAAGGVATGRHIAASLMLGAVGVWIGTAWLTTFEHQDHLSTLNQQKLLEAGPEDTVISRADSGKTLRQIRSAWSMEWEADSAPAPLKMPFQDILVGDVLGAIDEHNVDALVHSPAGQGIGWFNEIRSVDEVMQDLVNEAITTLS
ncbi:MAG: nitronate monooxygenase [Gammaproteobacteria bacterium]|jgi:NAD(P)H-dependent flavin oxidoreductase YrpB (nitropropane dioxygenase family)|nr:nitronate monooxygenase [Gammaproteobacteria bacterium]MBT5204324.1 nitronate monooxygenase [Gammaproteobacteria bacterium]MBT5604181.1 nitronate monooxygenase [Gammaproteobacteria bacterium]MBT6244873.1 nitronate monooxygenase [Gammaproteobacteria bacterium]